MDQVTEPQDIDIVHRNVSVVVRQRFGDAYSDRFAGMVTLFSRALGMSPRNPVVWVSIIGNKLLQLPDTSQHTGESVSPYAFIPKLDGQGQMHITPRHRRLRKLIDRECPAVHSQVQTSEGQRRSLLVFMKTIGDVAVDEIYPRQFDITAKC